MGMSELRDPRASQSRILAKLIGCRSSCKLQCLDVSARNRRRRGFGGQGKGKEGRVGREEGDGMV